MKNKSVLSYWLARPVYDLIFTTLINAFTMYIMLLNLLISIRIFLILVSLLIIVSLIFIQICLLKHGFFHRVHRFESLGQKLVVVDYISPLNARKCYRELQVRGIPGAYTKIPLKAKLDNLPFYDYCRLFVRLAFTIDCNRALILGGGGGLIPKFLVEQYSSIKVDVVEICPSMIEVSKEFFIPDISKDTGKLQFWNEDAEKFIEDKSKKFKYQFIFNDLFIANKPPEFTYSRTFLENLKNILAYDGIIVVNMGKPQVSHIKQCIENYKVVFGKVYVFVDNGAVVLVVETENRNPSIETLLATNHDYAEELSKIWLLRH